MRCDGDDDRRGRALHRWRLLGNPGPGGWGAILRWRGGEGVVRRRASDHQQSHGADGRDPGAGSLAEAPERRPPTPTASLRTASPAGSTAGRSAAGRPPTKPVKNVDLWKRLDAAKAPTTSSSSGCAAMPATRKTKRGRTGPQRLAGSPAGHWFEGPVGSGRRSASPLFGRTPPPNSLAGARIALFVTVEQVRRRSPPRGEGRPTASCVRASALRTPNWSSRRRSCRRHRPSSSKKTVSGPSAWASTRPGKA